ncbi:MAG: class I SAM-dependent methyltransferase [Pseudomonadota bacterium]
MKYTPEQIDRIKGFLDPVEGKHLFDISLLAADLGPCLEIGSYCGKSSVYIGQACKEKNSTLFSIDHHRGSEEQQPGEEYFDPELFDYRSFRMDTLPAFRKTLSVFELEDTVVPIVAKSGTAAKSWATPLGMVFIDGGHSDEAARTDYQCWAGHIVPGGYLLIHDIFPDPEKGGQAPYDVYKLALSSGSFVELPMMKTLGVLRKKRRASCRKPESFFNLESADKF